MPTINYDQGDLVRVTGVFTTSAGTAIDPSTVRLAFRADAIGTTTIWTYGSDASLVRSGTGTYYGDLNTDDAPGRWEWNLYSTGTGQAAENGEFYVRRVLTTPAPVSDPMTTINAANVTFLASGTGAVNRGVREKLREWVSITDFGASTTLTDNSSFVQAAIDAAGTTGSVYVPEGTFEMRAALTSVGDNIHLWGDGPGISVLWWSQTGMDGWNISAGSTAENLTFRGPNATSAGNAGLDSGGVAGVTIQNCIIEQWGDAGINTGGSSSRWIIRNNLCRDNRAQGIFLGGSTTDCVVEGNISTGNYSIGIDCNGSRNLIRGNQVYSNGVGGVEGFGILIAALTGAGNSDTNYNIVVGNLVRDENDPGILLVSQTGRNCNYNVIANNVCIAQTSANGDGITVGDGSAAGTYRGNAIIGNICESNARYGIFVDGTSATVTELAVHQNICRSNINDGIEINGDSLISVQGNICHNNSARGIHINAGTDCTVLNNVCTGNTTAQITDSSTTPMTAMNRETTGTPNPFISLSAQAPGVNTAFGYLRGYGANAAWPFQLSSIYDASFVYQYLVFNAELSGTAAAPTLTKGGTHGAAWFKHDPSSNLLAVAVTSSSSATLAPAHCMEWSESSTSGDCFFSIYRNGIASALRVSVGAADSGGAGFRYLRIPN